MDLAAHKFFSFFPAAQSKVLQQGAKLHKIEEPCTLFEQGDKGGSLFLVLDGEVEISGLTSLGNYQIISELSPGEFFGEFCIIDGGPRSARVRVPSHCSLAEISREAFLEVLDKSPVSAVRNLLTNMVKRIRSFHTRFFNEVVRSQKMVLVGELTNSIMHDLKSPLSVITGTTEVLKDKHRDMETQHMCELMDMQVKRVREMAQEVLDFVRGNTTLIQKSVNLESLFPYFELLNQDYFRRQGVELVMEPADVSLHADPDKLVRVLQNLTNNAAQAMAHGGRIVVSTRAEGDWVEICVKDDGPGIPKEIRDRVFEPFVGEDKHGGTGLGTTIAKSLVESHGGRISFKTSSTGTTFIIRLPKRLDVTLE